MQFSNPFDNLQGQFYILRNEQQQYSLWPHHCALPQGWSVECPPQSLEACNARLAANWSTLTPPTMRPEEPIMTTRLPLVAAQPGIWMAERLSTLPGAWSVAHYVELRGDIDPVLLGRAIITGLSQADTLSMRFVKIAAKPGSGLMNAAFCRTGLSGSARGERPARRRAGEDAGRPRAESAGGRR